MRIFIAVRTGEYVGRDLKPHETRRYETRKSRAAIARAELQLLDMLIKTAPCGPKAEAWLSINGETVVQYQGEPGPTDPEFHKVFCGTWTRTLGPLDLSRLPVTVSVGKLT